MSILRKALTTAAMTVALMAATGAHAETKRIALVVKALGIGFFEAANKGAEEAAKELGDVWTRLRFPQTIRTPLPPRCKKRWSVASP